MKQYIALLRGINVGGNNMVSMPELKQLFIDKGFTNVTTYINSGNIIFTSEIDDSGTVKESCEQLITDGLKLKIPVAIVAVDNLEAALNHAPAWWGLEAESKHNAIFVIPPMTVEAVFEHVGAAKPEYEQVDYYGNVIFWSAPIETFSRTRWSKVVGSPVYDSITIRNANTVKKLLTMAQRFDIS